MAETTQGTRGAAAGGPRRLVGQLVGGRYRLEELRSAGGSRSQVWRAHDTVLARTVAVRAVPADTPDDIERAQRFLDAAATAGRLTTPLATRTDDADVEEVGGLRIAYVVESWAEGRSLAAELADGPIDPDRALDLVRQVAEVLAIAEESGVHHGRLRPDDVVVQGDGSVVVTGFAVQAALEPGGAILDAGADTRAAAAILYAAVTGHWPGTGDVGLPPAPVDHGQLVAPRRLRGGLPRAFDVLALRALEPSRLPRLTPLERPGDLRDAVVDAQLGLAELPAVAPRPRRERRRWSPPTLSPRQQAARVVLLLGIPAVIVVMIAVRGYSFGRTLVHLPQPTQAARGLVPIGPASAPPGTTSTAASIPVTSVKDFDPEGDGHEGTSTVPLAVDQDSSTGWVTDIYQGSPKLGGLKPGVGLLFDLGSATTVGSVDLILPPGAQTIELRAGQNPGPTENTFDVVATAAGASGQVALKPAVSVSARYWLVWLTGLAPAPSGGYQGGVNEVTFHH
ncbi:MAG TPA: protein kinase family protein [Frankiaceae bacterium]